jgi:hypothetical protein
MTTDCFKVPPHWRDHERPHTGRSCGRDSSLGPVKQETSVLHSAMCGSAFVTEPVFLSDCMKDMNCILCRFTFPECLKTANLALKCGLHI